MIKANFFVLIITGFFELLSCGNKYVEVALKWVVLGAIALSIALWAVGSISGDLTTIIEYLRALISPAEVIPIESAVAPADATALVALPSIE